MKKRKYKVTFWDRISDPYDPTIFLIIFVVFIVAILIAGVIDKLECVAP